MKQEPFRNPDVAAVFDRYPARVRSKLLRLRQLIFEAAADTGDVGALDETLKWGEPSYLAKHGSTVRIDWKADAPDRYAVYFKCTSKLVPTFKEVYRDAFTFVGDRAIVLTLKDPIPRAKLRRCIATALRYHKVKHLPLLGMGR